jgi:hypothetical protein
MSAAMAYEVLIGDVREGGRVWLAGDVLPDGIGDEAMVAAGAIGPVRKKVRADATPAVAERAPVARPDYASMKAGELRAAGKALDPPIVFAFGSTKAEMVAALTGGES